MKYEGFPLKAAQTLFAAFFILLPAPAFADELQQQVLAFARTVTDEDFAFTQTLSNQRFDQAAKEYVMRYDPKRAKGARWSVLKFEGRAPTAKESAETAKRANAGNAPSYGRISRWFGAPAKRIATGNGTVTYRFASLPKGTMKINNHDASADTVAEAVVNTSGKTPFVERVRLISTKPFRMMMVAKVEKMEFVTIYRMFDGGKPMMIADATDMSGSLLGKSGWMKSRTSFSDIVPR